MSDNEEESIDIFHEPDGYFPPEKPFTFCSHTLTSGLELRLRLVGHNPLWGHHLWQGAIIVSRFLEEHANKFVTSRRVLELGAGAGLPSTVSYVLGASFVVVTDYPDPDLIDNLKHNVDACKTLAQHTPSTFEAGQIVALGHLWGSDATPLLKCADYEPDRPLRTQRFDTLILADLLFNHSCHAALLATIAGTLALHCDACALVFFTPYRPWLYDKDMAFFTLVRADGRFEVIELGTWTMDAVMFEEDPGDETLRRTVFGFGIRWRSQALQ